MSDPQTIARLFDAISGDLVALEDIYVARPGAVLDVSAADGVLANDASASGAPLRALFEEVGADGGGALFDVGDDGSFSFSPDFGFSGVGGFSYRLTDGVSTSDPIEVKVLVVEDVGPVALPDAYAMREGTSLTVSAGGGLLANDVDPDGLPLRVVAVVPPVVGGFDAFASEDGSFVYTPPEGFVGEATFSYSATDGAMTSELQTVRIQVVANQPPAAASDGYVVRAGETLNVAVGFGVLANDVDPEGEDLFAAQIDQETTDALTLRDDGSFVYQAAAGFSGEDAFSYRIEDAAGNSSEAQTVRVRVYSEAPSGADDRYAAAVDGRLVVSAAAGVLSNDHAPEDGLEVVGLVSRPRFGDLTINADGGFELLPPEGFEGDYVFVYRAEDANGAEITAEVVVDVGGAAGATVAAVDDLYAVAPGVATTISAASGLLSNDIDPLRDGLTLIDVDLSKLAGDLSPDGEGGFVYTPAPGFVGTETFTYEVADSSGAADVARATIDVRPGSAPVAGDDGYFVNINGFFFNAFGVKLTDNDVDPDGGEVRVVGIVDQPRSGTLDFNADDADGAFSYIPDEGFAGEDVFTYRIEDDEGDTAVGTARITVGQGVLFQPADDFYQTVQGRDFESTTENHFFANDYRSDGGNLDDLVFGLFNRIDQEGYEAGSGFFSRSGPEGVSIGMSVFPDFVGESSLAYRMQARGGETARISLLATPEAPPLAGDDIYAVPFRSFMSRGAQNGVGFNDFDREDGGSPASFRLTQGPANGSLAFRADGGFDYVPRSDFAGVDFFVYEAVDTFGNATPAVAYLAVHGAEVATARDDAYGATEGLPLSIDAATGLLGNDASGEALRIVGLSELPALGLISLQGDGAFVYTPSPGTGGQEDSFRYIAETESGVRVQAEARIGIVTANGRPNAVDDLASTVEQAAVVVAVLANDSDPDGDALTVSLVLGPDDGEAAVLSDGSIRYSPRKGFSGADRFVYAIMDDAGGRDEAAVTVEVAPLDRLIFGKAGGEALGGGAGDDRIFGREGDDRLAGRGGRDELFGNAGKDKIFGGSDRDYVDGGRGRDKVVGGAGADIVAGGEGRDLLKGGSGGDIFQVRRGDGRDLVLDWRDGEDRIHFQSGAGSLAELGIRQKNGGVLVSYGDKGDVLRLRGVEAEELGAGDFIFG